MRSWSEFERVSALARDGLGDGEIARTTGVPRRTVSDWRRLGRTPPRDPLHIIDEMPRRAYAYTLAMYLGDGCLSAHHRGVWALRLTLDSRYPGIIEEARCALQALRPLNRVSVRPRASSRCVDVGTYWKLWPVVLPHHGPGPKHKRTIELAPWQQAIVTEERETFIRGLIHSDGCRYMAHERKKGRHRYSVRYAFCNRSNDIKRLFCQSCDALGIRWTVTEKQVSVYRKDSVALLDTFVGPKF